MQSFVILWNPLCALLYRKCIHQGLPVSLDTSPLFPELNFGLLLIDPTHID